MRYFVVLLICCLLIGVLPVSGAVFSDVPAGHPAISAIKSLADKGIITGVAAETFSGRSRVTRYELAMTVFRAMARLEEQITADSPAVSDEDLNNIDYLKNELTEELGLLGLRVELAQNRKELLREEVSRLRAEIAAVDKAARSEEKVKMTGDWLVRHSWKSHRDDHARNAFSGRKQPGNSNNSLTESQIRLRFTAQIDDNIKIFTRFRLLNRGNDAVTAAASQRGGVFGLGGVGSANAGDMNVDCAFLEISRLIVDNDRLLLGRSMLQTGHGLLLNADFDAMRYVRDSAQYSLLMQYIYDRHRGSYRDDGNVDFRGVFNLGCSREFDSGKGYVNLFAQDNPNLINRRIPATFKLGTGLGEQKSDRRRDLEAGCMLGFGKKRALTADLAVALTEYRADIAAPAGAGILDIDLDGVAGHAALSWKTGRPLSARLAFNFGNDEFAGGYALSLDRRYSDSPETPYEDIARGNGWFQNGLINMSDMKVQIEYQPVGRHYFRVAADFLREMQDHARNNLAHHLAGNADGVVPVGYVMQNSPYDTFNNLGISDPSLHMMTMEDRYRLAADTRLRVGFTQCDFDGDAFRSVGGSPPVKAGRGFRGDYDYTMVWTELFSKF